MADAGGRFSEKRYFPLTLVVAIRGEGVRVDGCIRSKRKENKIRDPMVSLTEGKEILPREPVRSVSAAEKLGMRRRAAPIRFAVFVVKRDTQLRHARTSSLSLRERKAWIVTTTATCSIVLHVSFINRNVKLL